MTQANQKKLAKLSVVVMDGVDYFENGRLEELKTDDKHYINAFIQMIGLLAGDVK